MDEPVHPETTPAKASITRQPRPETIMPHDAELPPPRPGTRYVRVRMLGIVVADDDLRARIDRFFHQPMLILALLVLPLLAIEVFYLEKHPELKGTTIHWLVLVAFGLIWLAFLIEFFVKIAIAECRIEYVKHNWLDVIIIIAPMLRPLRAMKIAKTSKVFTLRGVGMKFLRYGVTLVVGLEATDRLLQRLGIRTDNDRPNPSTMTRLQLQREVKRLRRLADNWESWYEAHEAEIFEDRDEAPHLAEGNAEAGRESQR